MTSARKRQPTRTTRQHFSTFDAPDPTDHDTATTATTARRLRRTLSTMKGQQSPTTSPSEEFHCQKACANVADETTRFAHHAQRKQPAEASQRQMPTKNHLHDLLELKMGLSALPSTSWRLGRLSISHFVAYLGHRGPTSNTVGRPCDYLLQMFQSGTSRPQAQLSPHHLHGSPDDQSVY